MVMGLPAKKYCRFLLKNYKYMNIRKKKDFLLQEDIMKNFVWPVIAEKAVEMYEEVLKT